MKTMIQWAFAAVLALMPVHLLAHADHGSFEPVSAVQASEVAGKVLSSLIGSGKLASSWKQATTSPAERRDTQYGPVWVVPYVNAAEVDANKKTLYIFMDEFGNPVAANHENKL